MKITYPRHKGRVRLDGYSTLYILIVHGLSKTYHAADFWGCPFTFHKYADAVKGARVLGSLMKKYHWERFGEPMPTIAKITF